MLLMMFIIQWWFSLKDFILLLLTRRMTFWSHAQSRKLITPFLHDLQIFFNAIQWRFALVTFLFNN